MNIKLLDLSAFDTIWDVIKSTAITDWNWFVDRAQGETIADGLVVTSACLIVLAYLVYFIAPFGKAEAFIELETPVVSRNEAGVLDLGEFTIG